MSMSEADILYHCIMDKLSARHVEIPELYDWIEQLYDLAESCVHEKNKSFETISEMNSK